MGGAWLTARAGVRVRWRGTVGLILLTGLVSGAVLTAAGPGWAAAIPAATALRSE